MQSHLRLNATPGVTNFLVQISGTGLHGTISPASLVETSVPGYYSAELPVTLVPGIYSAQLSSGGVGYGTTYFRVYPFTELDSSGDPVYQVIDGLENPSAYQPILEEIRDLQRTGVTVSRLLEPVLLQLRGSIASRLTPLPGRYGFDQPLVKGDSYLGARSWQIRLTGFQGPPLLEASRILMRGKRFQETFEWLFQVVSVGETTPSDYVLTAELTSTQTQIAAGEWQVALVAEWDHSETESQEIITLIGPSATLQVTSLADSTSFHCH